MQFPVLSHWSIYITLWLKLLFEIPLCFSVKVVGEILLDYSSEFTYLIFQTNGRINFSTWRHWCRWLEKWLSDQVLFLQKTHFLFLTLTWQPRTIWNCSSRGSDSLLWHRWLPGVHVAHIHRCRPSHICIKF